MFVSSSPLNHLILGLVAPNVSRVYQTVSPASCRQQAKAYLILIEEMPVRIFAVSICGMLISLEFHSIKSFNCISFNKLTAKPMIALAETLSRAMRWITLV